MNLAKQRIQFCLRQGDQIATRTDVQPVSTHPTIMQYCPVYFDVIGD